MMLRKTVTLAQRADMIRSAERHERVAKALRDIADNGVPSLDLLDEAEVLDDWTWDSEHVPVVVGAAGADGRYHRTRAVLFLAPEGDAILTDDGWYRLAWPKESFVREGFQQ